MAKLHARGRQELVKMASLTDVDGWTQEAVLMDDGKVLRRYRKTGERSTWKLSKLFFTREEMSLGLGEAQFVEHFMKLNYRRIDESRA